VQNHIMLSDHYLLNIGIIRMDPEKVNAAW